MPLKDILCATINIGISATIIMIIIIIIIIVIIDSYKLNNNVIIETV